jgi:sulfide:quinone oxidoreductase
MAHTALVLGGGIGGIVVANELRKRARATDRVILVERNPIHVFAPSLLWVATGARHASRIQKPLRDLLRSGVEIIYGSVESVDPINRTATVNGQKINADAMVIALGAELSPDSVSGLVEAGYSFYTLSGAESLRAALDKFMGGKVVVLTAQAAYKCPAAPYEQAMLIADMLRRRGLHGKFTVEMYAAEPAPMAVAGAAVGEAVKSMLREKGIPYFPNRQVAAVDAAARAISFPDGTSTTYDLLAFVPPHRPPHLLAEAGFGGEAGWIPVDRATLQTRFEDVYAIGDVTSIPLAIGKPLPKAGVFAHAQGKIVAENIVQRWASSDGTARFDGHGACFVETGGSRAALGTGNFYAEPAPAISLKPPSILWHAAKVLFEKRWLRQFPF